MDISEVSGNEFFIKIKKSLDKRGDIDDNCFGESNYAEQLSLSKDDIPSLRNLIDPCLQNTESEENETSLDIAVVAWRTIAEFNICEAIQLLLERLNETEAGDLVSDTIWDELVDAACYADQSTVTFLCDFILSNNYKDITVQAAINCLNDAMHDNRDMANIAKSAMIKKLDNYKENSPEINAYLIDGLRILDAKEASETMERAFAVGKVDESYTGLWGEIRKDLGVTGIGLVPDGMRVTPNPYKNIIKDARLRIQGILVEQRMAQQKLKKAQKRQKELQKEHSRKNKKQPYISKRDRGNH